MSSKESGVIQFTAIATVTEIRINDVSKRAGIKKLKTTIAIAIEEITPLEIAQQCQFKHLDFIEKTQKGDEQIAVGDRVTLEVRAYDLAQPDYFTLVKMTKMV